MAAWIDFRAPGRKDLEPLFLGRCPTSLTRNPTIHHETVEQLLRLGTRSLEDSEALLEPLLMRSVLTAKQRQRLIASGALARYPSALYTMLDHQNLTPRDVTNLVAFPELRSLVATYVLQRPARFRTEKREDLEYLLEIYDDATTRVDWLIKLPDRFAHRVEAWLGAFSGQSGVTYPTVIHSLLEVRPEIAELMSHSQVPEIRACLANSRHVGDLERQLRVGGLDRHPLHTTPDEWMNDYGAAALNLSANPRCHLEVLEMVAGVVNLPGAPTSPSAVTLSKSISYRMLSFRQGHPTIVGPYETVKGWVNLEWLIAHCRGKSYRWRSIPFPRRLDAAALQANPNIASWHRSGLRSCAAKPRFSTLLTGLNQYAADPAVAARKSIADICDGRCRPDPGDSRNELRLDASVEARNKALDHEHRCTMSAWRTAGTRQDEIRVEKFVNDELRSSSKDTPWHHHRAAPYRAAASLLAERLGNSPRAVEIFLGLQGEWHQGVSQAIETAALLAES